MILLEFLNKILISLIGTGCNLRLSNLLYTEFKALLKISLVFHIFYVSFNDIFLHPFYVV